MTIAWSSAASSTIGPIGTAMSHSIAKLAPGAAVHLHPLDVDALGHGCRQ